MMVVFIGLLTAIMVLDCLFLILLVLMQLPKKEAGVGVAFGGSATDALFGAGSGNFLTKATKWSAIIFFVLAVVIGILQSRLHNHSNLRTAVEQMGTQSPQTAPVPAVTPPANQSAAPMTAPVAPAGTNLLLSTPAPAAPAQVETNSPAPQK